MPTNYTGLLGIAVILVLAWIFSSERKAIRWPTVIWGMVLQFAFGIVILKGKEIAAALDWVRLPESPMAILVVGAALLLVFARRRQLLPEKWTPTKVWTSWAVPSGFIALRFGWIERVFEGMRQIVNKLMEHSATGAAFVFGDLARQKPEGLGFFFAFQVLPTIIFIASIFAILYYLGVMQVVVRGFAKLMTRFLGASGAESLSVAASIFMGQTEAPLTIRPFLDELTDSELLTVMTAGMATVSGAIMVAYVSVAHVDVVHLLTASIIVAPGSIVLAKMLIPETKEPKTGSNVDVEVPEVDVNVIDAAARGASEGVNLSINVAAMLIAFIALVALVNSMLGGFEGWMTTAATGAGDGMWGSLLAHVAAWTPKSLESLLGHIFQPVALMIGVSLKDSATIGSLLGTRMVLNEFVAFVQLGDLRSALSPRSFEIATFALCGFANFSSIAIQIGGIGALAPSRRHDLARLGIRAMLAGTGANFISAAIAGMLLK